MLELNQSEILDQDETMDIVNDEDVVIGTTQRSHFYKSGDTRFRVVNAFLINSKCQIWVPNRNPQKYLYPSCFDSSIGGHVKAGETYEEALAREAQEELNMDISRENVYLWKKFYPYEHGLSCHMKVFFIFTNETPEFNRDDFHIGEWYFPGTIKKKVLAGAKTRSDVAILLSLIPPNEWLIKYKRNVT